MLHKTEIECEKCGCRDVEEVDRYMGHTTYKCNHCGTNTIDGPNPYEEICTEFKTTVCPICDSTNNKVTRGPQQTKDGRYKRFHKCADCRNPFASYEVRK